MIRKFLPGQVAVPITWESAEAALTLSEERFQAGDVEGLISKYHEDIVIRFASLPEFRGREVAKAWLQKRLQRQLKKYGRSRHRVPPVRGRPTGPMGCLLPGLGEGKRLEDEYFDPA